VAPAGRMVVTSALAWLALATTGQLSATSRVTSQSASPAHSGWSRGQQLIEGVVDVVGGGRVGQAGLVDPAVAVVVQTVAASPPSRR
jgi:hypothetical protein